MTCGLTGMAYADHFRMMSASKLTVLLASEAVNVSGVVRSSAAADLFDSGMVELSSTMSENTNSALGRDRRIVPLMMNPDVKPIGSVNDATVVPHDPAHEEELPFDPSEQEEDMLLPPVAPPDVGSIDPAFALPRSAMRN